MLTALPKLDWILIFIVNGVPMQSQPQIAEACLLHMLSKPAIEQPFCYNFKTKQKMTRPADCVEYAPGYCRKD